MGIATYVTDEESGHQAHVQDSFSADLLRQAGGRALTVIEPKKVFGQFTTASRVAEGTSTVLVPPSGGSILLTDLIISADKVQNGSVTLVFTDGTESIILYSGIVTDAPINIALPIGGRFRGWEDAHINLITVGAVKANVTLGYLSLTDSLTYSSWNAQR